MARIWTHGVWTVKPGHEDEFVEAWRAMAGAVAEDVERFRGFIRLHLDGIREPVESLAIYALEEVPLDG
jgi:hypothetical protein